MKPLASPRARPGSVRDRHKRTVGFIESAMPADGIPRCHSPRTETSARPVSKSSFKEDYRILRTPKRPSYWPGCRKNNPVKTNGSDVRVGSKPEKLNASTCCPRRADIPQQSRHV